MPRPSPTLAAAAAAILVLLLAPGTRASGHEATMLDSAVADAAAARIVRSALTHRLLGDEESLRGDLAAVRRLDRERKETGLPPTGLADEVLDLTDSLITDPVACRHALQDALDRHPDPVLRRRIEHRLESDDAEAARQLLADDRHNRRAMLLNGAVRPLGVWSGALLAAFVNPFLLAGSAVDSVATTAINLWHYNHLTPAEREALVRFRRALARSPGRADAPEIAREVHRLERKVARAECRRGIAAAQKARKAADLERARFELAGVAEVAGCKEALARERRWVEKEAGGLAAAEQRGLAPRRDARGPAPAEARDYRALAYALAAADPGRLVEAASIFARRHPRGRFVDDARYALAVARHLGGHPAEAREELEGLAREMRNSNMGRHAARLLATPSMAALGGVEEAERAHRRARLRYVLFGARPDGRTTMYRALQVGAGGVAAAETLGIVNVLGVLTRAVVAWRHDPASNREIIERGERFLAREPPVSPRAREVHARLAAAYEREGNYGRALLHARAMAHPEEKRIASLEEKLASQLLERAEHDPDEAAALYRGIVTHLGSTRAAREAQQRLASRADERGDLVLARDLLVSAPELTGRSGLDIEPALLDGKRANGEITDRGVKLGDGKLRLYLDSPDGKHDEVRYLAPDAYAHARAAAEEALYRQALLGSDHREVEAGALGHYIPIYLQGTVGESGVAIYPGVKLRPYRSENPELYR